MKHIKTPVKAIDTATETLIWDAEDELLAIGSGDAQGKLEIGEIIQAINERDALVEAIEAQRCAIEQLSRQCDIISSEMEVTLPPAVAGACLRASNLSRTALAAAKGEQ